MTGMKKRQFSRGFRIFAAVCFLPPQPAKRVAARATDKIADKILAVLFILNTPEKNIKK